MKVFSTGIEEFDEALGGGVPRNSSFLLLGNLGTDPEVLAFEMLYSHLNEGGQGVLSVFDYPPSEVRDKMEEFGWGTKKFEEEEKFILADFYTHAFSLEEFYKPEKYYCKKPTDYTYITNYLNTIREKLVQKSVNGNYLGVVLSLTTLVQWCGENDALKLAYLMATKYRPLGCTIFVLNPSAVSQSTLAMLGNRSEVVIKLFIGESERFPEKKIGVLKSPLPRWLNKPLLYTVLPERGFFIGESI